MIPVSTLRTVIGHGLPFLLEGVEGAPDQAFCIGYADENITRLVIVCLSPYTMTQAPKNWDI